jgi:hypothetical protein
VNILGEAKSINREYPFLSADRVTKLLKYIIAYGHTNQSPDCQAIMGIFVPSNQTDVDNYRAARDLAIRTPVTFDEAMELVKLVGARNQRLLDPFIQTGCSPELTELLKEVRKGG